MAASDKKSTVERRVIILEKLDADVTDSGVSSEDQRKLKDAGMQVVIA